MGLYIVLTVFAVVILAIAFVFLFLHKERGKATLENTKHISYMKRQETASHGTAVVIRAEGGIPQDGATQVRVSLSLEVTPPGRAAYRAHTDWLVGLTALSWLHEGANIGVRIDAQDPKTIYPAEEWAKYIPK
jgi:hypothetical protein